MCVCNFNAKDLPEQTSVSLQVGSRTVPLLMVHHPRARRYLLRLRPDGTVQSDHPATWKHFGSQGFRFTEHRLAGTTISTSGSPAKNS